MSLSEHLNDSQRQAVEYCEGPQLVIAGAGSGKTRVLTYKIAYLLQQGMKPWNILALTFTNKAANEMKQRIGDLVGHENARQLAMGTFHSVFSRILRVEAASLGFIPGFTIYDEADSRSLLKSIIKDMGLDEKVYKPSAVHARISMAKNHLISTEQYAVDAEALERDRNSHMPQLFQVYSAYVQRCRKANAMDFDDLLVYTHLLFKRHEDIRKKYAQRFQYVLVDEYQDTNYAQQCIVSQLSGEHQRVCVVGDDAQSIYAFRGANIDNILDFQKVYPSARLFKLEQNYRSTQCIVQAANSLIRKNARQIPKEVFSEKEKGERLLFKQAYSDKEEAAIVCKEIKRIKRQDQCEYSDFAILYRTNAQSRSFEEEMRKHSIPYRIYGGLSFYQRKEVKDIIAYFRLVVNHDDEEALKRVINYPARGIGNTTLQKLARQAQAHGVSFWQVMEQPVLFGLDVNKGTLAKLDGFRAMIKTFSQKLQELDVYDLGKEIITKSGVSADLYSGKEAEDLSRQENLEELLASMQDFVVGRREEGRGHETGLPDFLQEVALLSDLDSDDGSEAKVSLMTVHAAKGLEFPTVFVVGLEENIFPSQLSLNSARELEEERRLLYVAITRAERHCLLTCAKNRWRYGRMEFGVPSRFLGDIDSRWIDKEEEAEDGFEIDRPYTGSRLWGNDYPQYSSRMQNSRPVASQFRADVQPKITRPARREQAVDPFSQAFKQRIQHSGGNLRRVADAMASGGRSVPSPVSAQGGEGAGAAGGAGSLREGMMIEHQRFGKGTVLKVEGTGENTKATVEFLHTGTKQLLLKFARFNILG